MTKSLDSIRKKIIDCARQYGRTSDEIQLLAVSKMQTAGAIRALCYQGQIAFGENYLQEALSKQSELLDCPLQWHYIGQIQSNKTRLLATHFDWVQTVSSEKIAQRLNDQRPEHLPSLNVLIQVNLDEESQKSGAPLNQVFSLAKKLHALPRLRFRGLMAIPKEEIDFIRQRASFARFKALFDELNRASYGLDVLSMGMSQDLEAAIAEGSTLVRIGTALFGQRGKKTF